LCIAAITLAEMMWLYSLELKNGVRNLWKYRSKKLLPQIALHRYWNSNFTLSPAVFSKKSTGVHGIIHVFQSYFVACCLVKKSTVAEFMAPSMHSSKFFRKQA
jgi:hypothetical protein